LSDQIVKEGINFYKTGDQLLTALNSPHWAWRFKRCLL